MTPNRIYAGPQKKGQNKVSQALASKQLYPLTKAGIRGGNGSLVRYDDQLPMTKSEWRQKTVNVTF